MRSTVRALLGFTIATLVGLLATSPPVFAGIPYSGTPVSIPGTVEAENFDQGGEGVAYHDSTSANEPGAYRNEGVDVEASAAASNGHDVGWVTSGEWLEYTVNVQHGFFYIIQIRHASEGPGGTLHIEFDGLDKTGPIELPNTGGWQTWSVLTLPRPFALNSGEQVMRVVFDRGSADGWLANIDQISFSISSSFTRRIEAENYNFGGEGVGYHDSTPENEPGAYRNDGVDVEVTSDEGGGFDVGWVRSGEWLEYRIRTGPFPYSFQIRHASQGPGGTMHIEIDGEDKTGPIVLPDTGGWQNWQTTRTPRWVTVPFGNPVIRVVFDEPGPDGWLANINYIDLRLGPGPASGPRIHLPDTIEAENYDFGGEGVAFHDTTPENEGGAGYSEHTGEGVDVEVTSDAGGGFDVGWIRPGEWIIYSVDIREGGTYTIDIRCAAEGFGGTMHIELEGVDITGPINLPDTGGWQTWQTVNVPNVRLDQDTAALLRLVFDAGNADGWLANINWVRFTRTGP